MIKKIVAMLLILCIVSGLVVVPASAADNNRTVDAYCEHCKKNETWYALTVADDKMTDGHYFLGFDGKSLTFTEKKISGKVCLLLDDKEYVGNRRITVQSGGSLSVQGMGILSGRGADNFGPGGAVWVQEGATLNLYSGTMTYKPHGVATRGVTNGGVVAVDGTFNMYGGTVKAGLARDLGGSIYVGATGQLNLYGGTVLEGEATTGTCIYNTGKVRLAGNAQVTELLQAPESVPLGEMLTVAGEYTGKVTLQLPGTITENMTVGTSEDAQFDEAQLRLPKVDFKIKTTDGKLVTYLPEPVLNMNTGATYETLTQAVAEAAPGHVLLLQQDVAESVTTNKTVILDLDGHRIDGTFSATQGIIAYVRDSQAEDLGAITAVSGDVRGAGATPTTPAYLPYATAEGITYRTVQVAIESMSLRPEAAGIYYTGNFRADALVESQVASYGIAVSLAGMPAVDDDNTLYTAFDGSTFATQAQVTGTLVKNILNTANTDAVNTENANTVIYARAYIRLQDGTYLYGAVVTRSLMDQLKAIDSAWETFNYAKQSAMLRMYNTFANLMPRFNLERIHYAFTTEEEETMKILSIGQSHSQDSVWLVQEVLQTEMPDKKFFVAECIKSVTMVDHVNNAQTDAPVYTYYVNTSGRWEENPDWTIRQALLDQRWDVIVINESSRLLGKESTMKAGLVNKMVDFIHANVDYDFQLLYNWTWTTPTDQTFHSPTYDPQPSATFWSNFERDYQADRKVHYDMMLAMLEKYVEPIEGIDGILYCATPIQYATEVIGVPQVDMYRDYIHLSDYGRLYIAYLWYAQIYGLDKIEAVNVDVIEAHLRQWRWVSKGDVVLTEQMKQWIIEAVNYTLEHPKEMPE